MRIDIHTSDPTSLWNKIKKDISDEKVKTWAVVLDANKAEYLTHLPAQWFKKALLKPTTASQPSRLILTVAWYSNDVPTEYIKGLYVGRFTEELLEHYRSHFIKLETFA